MTDKYTKSARGQHCTVREWRDIVGLEGKYQVSSDGNVRSLPRRVRMKTKTGRWMKRKTSGCVMKKHMDSKGYFYVTIQVDTHRKHYSVARLVASAFVPNPERKPEVNHIDSNRANDHFLNLEWCTRFENMQHAFRCGRGTVPGLNGSRHPNAKLTEQQVVEILRRIRSGEAMKQIAEDYPVSYGRIRNIKSFKDSWKHVRAR